MGERPFADNPNRAPEKPAPEKPFAIELERLDRQPGGHFRPHARLTVSPALRTSGLLSALPPDELKSLLLMLTFVHPNGHCTPTVRDLSQAMGVSGARVWARMRRLAAFRWVGGPVAVEIRRESGMDAFSPAPILVEVREPERLCPHCGRDVAEPPSDSSESAAAQRRRREQVVLSSREQYARPREQVERMIAEQMGWNVSGATGEGPQEPAPGSAEAGVRQRLAGIGVSREQVDFLLAQFDLERITRQIEWLPYRKAKNRAAFLVAAIEENYEAPLGLRDGAPAAISSDAPHEENPAA